MSDDFEDFPGLLTHQEAHQEDADEPPLRSRSSRVEVLGRLNGRRQWTPQEKARITRESFGPAARVADVARRNGVSEGLLYQWRKTARDAGGGGVAFVPVQLDDMKPGPAIARNLIEIDIGGATLRVNSLVDVGWLRAVLAAVRR